MVYIGGIMSGAQSEAQAHSNPIMEIRSRLSDLFVEREQEIDAILVGLLSREPVILVGEPGVAKTSLIESLAKLVNAKVFCYLLTRFTEPDELFGPVDIRSYREGKLRRILEGTAITANIVFLDEIFKASSAIRNTLLRVLNEREYRFGNQVVRVEWLGFYTASNEVSTDTSDKAFYDRLVIRRFVKDVSITNWKRLLVRGIELEGDGGLSPVTTADTIRNYQVEVVKRFKEVKRNGFLLGKYVEALVRLRRENVVISDRRKVKVLKVASAFSFLYNEKAVTLDDIADALRVVAVHEEDDLEKIEKVISEIGLSESAQLLREVNTIITELKNVTKQIKDTTNINEFKELRRKGKLLIGELRKRLERLRGNPRANVVLDQVEALIDEFRESVAEVLGEL